MRVDSDLLDRMAERRTFWATSEPPKRRYYGHLTIREVPSESVKKVRRRSWRRSQEARAWALAVKARDGECLECGSVMNLHAHHVDRSPELRLDLDNGRTLCVGCHRLEHPYLPDALFLES